MKKTAIKRTSLFAMILLIMCTLGLITGCSFSSGGHFDKDHNPNTYSLNLPESYYIEIQVDSSSEVGTQTNTYILSEADGWIYLKLGYDREQYVYKPISNNKYIEYKYDVDSGKYKPTMISDALQEQIDKGNVPLDSVATSKDGVDAKLSTLDTYIIQYKTLTSSLSYVGKETVNNVECEKYSGYVDAVITRSDFEFCIDPVTGLAFKYVNKTKTGHLTILQTNQIVVFSNQARIPTVD